MFLPRALNLSSFEIETHTVVFNKKNWYRSFSSRGEEFVYSIFHTLRKCDKFSQYNQQQIAAGIQVLKHHGEVKFFRDNTSRDFITYDFIPSSEGNRYILTINTFFESFNEHRFAFTDRAAENFMRAFIKIDALYEKNESGKIEP